MKIKFVGAVGKVTGSCTWCIHPRTGTQFLVDCGLVQGGMNQEAENNMPFPFEPNRLKFVLLTHAHMDHCGRIPQLYAQGFRGKVICTAATARLTLLQLQNAHDIAEKRAKHEAEKQRKASKGKKNRPRGPHVKLPPYPRSDWFYPIDQRRRGFEFKKPQPIDEDIRVSFQRSSHMLGGCSISVMWAQNYRKSVCFSGDVGSNSNGNCYQSLMKKNQVPHWNTSYFVAESTYGGREPREEKFKDFAGRMSALGDVIDSGCGTIVIPCFSLQRTQEVLVDAWHVLCARGNEQSREWEIFLDSPLAIRACEVFREELQRGKPGKDGENMYLNEELARHMGKKDAQEAIDVVLGGKSDWVSFKELADDEDGETPPSAAPEHADAPPNGKKRIIITSSGMCHAGPVLSHLPLLENKGAAFVITGFQSTFNGKQLLDVADKQEKGEWDRDAGEDVRLFTDVHEENQPKIRVRARVFNLAPYYSGHADVNGLLDYILEFGKSFSPNPDKPIPPATVFLNHGDNPSRENLRRKILARAYASAPNTCRKIQAVEIPRGNSPFFDLERGEWESPSLLDQLGEILARWAR